MIIIKDPKELQQMSIDLRRQGKTIALVPTMGYFHEGHLSLMDAAQKKADKVIVSLFVNPTQFGPNEDLDNYPHDLQRDSDLARERGVDILFAPEKNEMYYPDHSTWVEVPGLATNLCGKSRPVHFRGVTTIVTKLFMTALPDIAVFGEKDWQQLAIIKRMVRDLNIPVEVVGHPIVRNSEGLALSSRNVYLTDDEKKLAPLLQKGLRTIKDLVDKGEHDAEILINKLTEFYKEMIPGSEIDYIQIVHPENITVIEEVSGPALCAVAVRFGKARLLDNLLIKR
ncbi:pantoate--beta-alanine ligase [Maridesulfovibrio ferrireducens]|uniref:pantoate--beta-alanine ligase n=1 Tax=Maridesulfovibrio ferrireducens TaxID=246191 RepID=UPI001A2B45BC|nr:pantoate--beta-alanine ligase [Maridesulfovibrio ferrireducens]MBI9112868.1 pantoate--beta-alanine ligase [Maridesulfovibrio ferrireducens]